MVHRAYANGDKWNQLLQVGFNTEQKLIGCKLSIIINAITGKTVHNNNHRRTASADTFMR